MKCDKCGAELKDDALFCGECGANTLLAQIAAKRAAKPESAAEASKKPVPKPSSQPVPKKPVTAAPQSKPAQSAAAEAPVQQVPQKPTQPVTTKPAAPAPQSAPAKSAAAKAPAQAVPPKPAKPVVKKPAAPPKPTPAQNAQKSTAPSAPVQPKAPQAAPMSHEADSMPEIGQGFSQGSFAKARAKLSPGIDNAIVTGRKQTGDPLKGLSADLSSQTVKPIRVVNLKPLKVIVRILVIIIVAAIAAGVVMYFTGMLYKYGVVEKVYDMTGVCIQHHAEDGVCTVCGKEVQTANSGDTQAAEASSAA